VNRLVVLAALVACSSGSKPPEKPQPRPELGDGSGSAGGPVVAASDAPSEGECDALLAHVTRIAVGERPDDQKIDKAQQERVREDVRGQFLDQCREMSRSVYQCAMAGKTLAEISACK
jgi:hypothetical protein